MREKRWTAAVSAVAVTLGLAVIVTEAGAWPNGPTEDPLLDPPNDPGYLERDGQGRVVGGEWNFWSFVPEVWADNPGFRQEEIPLGTGMWVDKAWQVTTGAPEVIIAVLDSGVYWDNTDLVNRYHLNRHELDTPQRRPRVPEGYTGDAFDVNDDGRFNVKDYLHFFPEEELARLDGAPGNGNGMIDPEDLILHFSDGVDDDGNGYFDDISGWDFFWSDNNAYDDNRFGHGNGEARDSGAEGNNGIGSIGVCPNCTLLMVRVGDSFVTDANDFGDGVIFGVDSGAKVIQEALGTVNSTPLAVRAIEYAYGNNVGIIASAADELSFHHNMPGTNNHTIYVHAIVHDGPRAEAKTFLNYNNCTNYGGQLLLSSPGGGCSSEATGVTSGHAGLIYSAAFETGLTPPLSSEELRGILIMSADDISVPESLDDSRAGLPCDQFTADQVCGTDGLFRCFIPIQNKDNPAALPVGECFNTKFPSQEGWDWHFGYGRNNARRSVDMVVTGQIPPEVDIVSPLWFETVDPMQTPSLSITGRIGVRKDGLPARYNSYNYVVEYALGVDPKGGWIEIASGTTEGIDGELAALDLSALPAEFNWRNRPTDPHEDAITLRVRVTANGPQGEVRSEFRKTAFVYHDDTLKPGFPLNLHSSAEGSPKFWDLDGDNKDELIVATSEGLLHAFKLDGTERAGFPVGLGFRRGYDPADPQRHTTGCAFREDKTGCAAANIQVDGLVHQGISQGAPAIGDLEGDGDVEILVATLDGSVFAFHHDGTPVAGFPVTSNYALSETARVEPTREHHSLDHGFVSSPVLYDLDGDGDLEVIQTGMDQHVYVWHHDGQTKSGFPVLCRDVDDGNRGFRIVVTPAVGDLDLDGKPEIVTGTNEYYNENEIRFYIVKSEGNDAPGGPFKLGAPLLKTALIGEVLPLVGQGVVGNPVIADIDFDGRPEFAMEGIAGVPIFYRLDEAEDDEDVTIVARANAALFGPGSNSLDAPAFPLINHGSVGRLDPSGALAYVKGTAGFNFASAFAEGGTRIVFDHQISAWNMNPAAGDPLQLPFIEGFPQVVEDWQFFMNPALVDMTGDGLSEILMGTGGYFVHAFDYKGVDAPGFPKFTGGWIIASPSVGDMDGDGTFEVATLTRNGWLYVWSTDASTSNRIDWVGYGHDAQNTNNYGTPIRRYSNTATCGNNVKEDGEGCDGADLGGATCESEGFASGALTCAVDCALDTTACVADPGDNNGNNGANNGSNNDTNGETPAPGKVEGGDGGCCAVPSARPTNVPLLPLLLALGALGVALKLRR